MAGVPQHPNLAPCSLRGVCLIAATVTAAGLYGSGIGTNSFESTSMWRSLRRGADRLMTRPILALPSSRAAQTSDRSVSCSSSSSWSPDETENGTKTLAELFNGRSQLLAYNIVYGPDYEPGACPGCTNLADGFEGTLLHLNKRENVADSRLGVSQAQPRRESARRRDLDPRRLLRDPAVGPGRQSEASLERLRKGCVAVVAGATRPHGASAGRPRALRLPAAVATR